MKKEAKKRKAAERDARAAKEAMGATEGKLSGVEAQVAQLRSELDGKEDEVEKLKEGKGDNEVHNVNQSLFSLIEIIFYF